jgi:hypothetical protein
MSRPSGGKPGACSVKPVIKAGRPPKARGAIGMLASADEDMVCERIGELGLNREMEMRGAPEAARYVADEIAEGGVHGRGRGGRHRAPRADCRLAA